MNRKKKLSDFLKDVQQNNELTHNNKRDLESVVRKLSNPKISEDTIDTILNTYRCIYNMNNHNEKGQRKKMKPPKERQEISTYELQKQKAMEFSKGIIYATSYIRGNKEQEEIFMIDIKGYEN